LVFLVGALAAAEAGAAAAATAGASLRLRLEQSAAQARASRTPPAGAAARRCSVVLDPDARRSNFTCNFR